MNTENEVRTRSALYVSSDYRAREVLIRCTDISSRRLWDLPPHAWMRLCESELPGDWWRVEFEYWSEEKAIANCRNLRALGRVSYSCILIRFQHRNFEILMNEKLPSQVWEFSAENCSNGSLAKVARFHTNPDNFVACLPTPYKLSILDDIRRATI